MASAFTVVLTETVDIAELARVYRKVHAADLHLADHRDPSVEDRLRWTAEAPGFAATVAYVDGEIAGAAGSSYRGGVMSLFGTSVLPRFRRRGIQQALIIARLGRGLSLHADLASITSHPGIPTERNAARLGFQFAYARAVMVKRGPGLVPSP